MSLVNLLPLADLGDLLPALPAALFACIPIVAILSRHQQKMAMILHERHQTGENDSRLLAEISALRQLVAQQSLTLDDLSRRQDELARRLEEDRSVRERLNA
jgi:hypothetical protein